MSSGEIDPTVVRRHLAAMRQSVEVLRAHSGREVDVLRENAEERWTVERGLQLCAQNALDISTHIAVGMGRDVQDYASAVDVLADIGVLPRLFAAVFEGWPDSETSSFTGTWMSILGSSIRFSTSD